MVKLGGSIIVLMVEDMSRGAFERAETSNHLAKSAKKIEVRISAFERLCAESLVESRESVAANLDTARSNTSPGAEEVNNMHNAIQSSKFAATWALVVRVPWDKAQAKDRTIASMEDLESSRPELVFKRPVACRPNSAWAQRGKDRAPQVAWKGMFLNCPFQVQQR
jgi:hypothetical protein